MPDYNPNEHPERWLLGACSSGDPLRWAVVAVAEKVRRLEAVEMAARKYHAVQNSENYTALDNALDCAPAVKSWPAWEDMTEAQKDADRGVGDAGLESPL